MKNLKKLALLGLITALTTACVGCSKKKETLSVGIVQIADNGAFTDMREGFINELREKGYDEDKLKITYKNAQGDPTVLNTICQDFVSQEMDLVATIATPCSQAMVNMESDIPVVFVSVSDPIGAGILTTMEKPDKHATGTSNAIPVGDIFALSDKLTPGCKTYGLIYNTSETNSVSTINAAKKYMDENGLSYRELVVTNASEVQQAAQTLVESVDAFFLSNDTILQSAMPVLTEIARDAKIPVYGSSAVMVNSGAFATIAISDTEIGKISADQAIEILEGKKPSEVPAKVVGATDTVVNQTTADALGITFPDEVKSTLTFVTDVK